MTRKPANPGRGRRWLRIAGNVLSALAVLFILQRLSSYPDQFEPGLARSLLAPVAALGAVHGAACLLLALAWRDALRHLGPVIGVREALHIYGVSQLAKYVPGNIFHLVGRQAKGLEHGLPGWPLAKSMAWELGLLTLAGSLFVVWMLPLLVPALGTVGAGGLFVLLTAGAAGLLGVFGSFALARSLLWDAAFLLVMGGLFAAVLLAVVGTDNWSGAEPVTLVVAAYVVGWLAGFLTPGAPAGVGVREVVVLGLLQAWFPEPALLAAVVAARFVSVIGDIAFFAFARWVVTVPAEPA